MARHDRTHAESASPQARRTLASPRVVVLLEIPRPFFILPLLPGRFVIHLQPLRRTAVFPNTHEHPPQSLAHRPARLEVPQPLKCFPHRVNCRHPFSPASPPIRLHNLDTRLSLPSNQIPLEELLPTRTQLLNRSLCPSGKRQTALRRPFWKQWVRRFEMGLSIVIPFSTISTCFPIHAHFRLSIIL